MNKLTTPAPRRRLSITCAGSKRKRQLDGAVKAHFIGTCNQVANCLTKKLYPSFTTKPSRRLVFRQRQPAKRGVEKVVPSDNLQTLFNYLDTLVQTGPPVYLDNI
eukprot:2558845-Pleurochrysis_carterae.AAC.2